MVIDMSHPTASPAVTLSPPTSRLQVRAVCLTYLQLLLLAHKPSPS